MLIARLNHQTSFKNSALQPTPPTRLPLLEMKQRPEPQHFDRNDRASRMQYSVHTPSSFICNHWDKLLPDWSHPVASVLVVLQACTVDLRQRSPTTEHYKQQLRFQFVQVADRVARHLHQLNYLADGFDPQTGLPLFSQPGVCHLDDVAVVRSCLGYPIVKSHGCCVVLHPLWGGSVYPSTLLSSADPIVMEQVMPVLSFEF